MAPQANGYPHGMPSVERTITTSTPLDRVWTYLSDFRTTEDWDPPTVRTDRTSGDGGLGTTYKNVSKFLGRETEAEYVVTAFDEEQLLQLSGKATGMELLDTITLAADGVGTEVTYRSEFKPQGAAKLASPLLGIGLEKLADDTAESLQQRLDALS
jgi:carbon monoxide dehydrogenase subunit G